VIEDFVENVFFRSFFLVSELFLLNKY